MKRSCSKLIDKEAEEGGSSPMGKSNEEEISDSFVVSETEGADAPSPHNPYLSPKNKRSRHAAECAERNSDQQYLDLIKQFDKEQYEMEWHDLPNPSQQTPPPKPPRREPTCTVTSYTNPCTSSAQPDVKDNLDLHENDCILVSSSSYADSRDSKDRTSEHERLLSRADDLPEQSMVSFNNLTYISYVNSENSPGTFRARMRAAHGSRDRESYKNWYKMERLYDINCGEYYST